jgi:site-specific recombinase XerD
MEMRWERYPLVNESVTVKAWLTIQINYGHACNTVEAYSRALEDYLRFCESHNLIPESASREDLANYIHDLSRRPHPGSKAIDEDHPCLVLHLANATLQQRLTAIRLYYDYLEEEGNRDDNPLRRGRHGACNRFGVSRERGIVRRYYKLPWIPNDDQWLAMLNAARPEPIRNRVMLAFAYDSALRREELCQLATGDIDPARRLLRVRAETTKNHQERVVPYSQPTALLFNAYLHHRQVISHARGPLFLSESRRNHAHPLSIWTWSKVVAGIAMRSGVPQLTTHTFRHLCLTDLARTGWELHEIARFAGHRSFQTTLTYIHLSGRDLARKLEAGMASIHSWRTRLLTEALQ